LLKSTVNLQSIVAKIHAILVGGFNHLEKYEFVNGKDDIPYMKWKIKAMFETTNKYQGLVTVPFWEYWTSPYSSHYRPYT